jgi:6-phosphofructokinase 1
LQGVKAVEALLAATPETPSYMIGIQENNITMVPLMEAVAMVRIPFICSLSCVNDTLKCQTKAVTAAIEARDFEKAMNLRDPEFRESLDGFVVTSALSTAKKLPDSKVY